MLEKPWESRWQKRDEFAMPPPAAMVGIINSQFKILLIAFLLPRALCAAEQKADECIAPDQKHCVLMVQAGKGVGADNDAIGSELQIRSVDAVEPLFSKYAGNQVHFNASTGPLNYRCLWSPDSKFVAVFARETKRSGDTTLYYLNNEKVQEIALPDLMPLIHPHLTAEMRALWVRPEVWLPEHGLLLSVEGTQMDEEHGCFRFILTIDLHSNKAGRYTTKVTSFRQDRSVPFSIK